MSTIDAYPHKLLGKITCAPDYSFVDFSDSSNELPVYKIEKDANESCFVAKAGDILIGGGSGEAPAFRISMPDAIDFYTTEDELADVPLLQVVQAYWTYTKAFCLGTAFVKLGWKPERHLVEDWLAQHAVSFLIGTTQEYKDRAGPVALEMDGSIIHLP